MIRQCVLAYDVGTSGVKTALIGMEGELIASTTEAYPIFTPQLGWTEQIPTDYWKAIVNSTRRLLEISQVDKENVQAMAFSTQALGIIPISEDGEVLYNNISWIDGRAGAQAETANRRIESDRFGAKSVIPKLLWIKEEQPEIYQKTKFFVDVNGYLRYRATGLIRSELSGANGYCLDLQNNIRDETIYNAVGLDVKKLPSIIQSIDFAGALTEKAARELGLLEGTPVYGGCDDVQAAALGAGTMEEGEGHIYLGSSAWLCITTKATPERLNGASVTKSADPKKNLIVGVTQSSGMSVDYAMNMLYMDKSRDAAFWEAEAEMKKILPGSDRLIVTPWLFGEDCPIRTETTRASVFNLTNLHTRAHILRAVLEGIGYNLRWVYENFQKDYGTELSEITVIGGGAQNDLWMQILSDVLQMKIKTVKDGQYAGCRGAAVCAMTGLGYYENFRCAKKMIKPEKEFLPQERNSNVYKKLFFEYKQIYKNLENSYNRINESEL